jgi:hypothetical protein
MAKKYHKPIQAKDIFGDSATSLPSDLEIQHAIMYYDGDIGKVADHFGLKKIYINTRIAKNPELQQTFRAKAFDMVDEAENTLRTVMGMTEEFPNAAVQAAKYVHQAYGKDLGYNQAEKRKEEEEEAPKYVMIKNSYGERKVIDTEVEEDD